MAKELQTRDPAAYESFTGRGERTAPALLGVLVVLCMGLFIGLGICAIDTGCVWGGQLTAIRLDADTPQVVQVQANPERTRGKGGD